jgi:hypothetical protein
VGSRDGWRKGCAMKPSIDAALLARCYEICHWMIGDDTQFWIDVITKEPDQIKHCPSCHPLRLLADHYDLGYCTRAASASASANACASR